MIYLVIFMAYTLSLFIFLPVYLALFYRHRFNLYSSSFLSFAVLFLIFAIFFLVSGSGYTSLTSGTEKLVEAGSMTMAGYFRALYSAFLIGLFGMLGGFIFSVFVRGRAVFRLSFI